jgi:hypothetical protein
LDRDNGVDDRQSLVPSLNANIIDIDIDIDIGIAKGVPVTSSRPVPGCSLSALRRSPAQS